MPDDDSSALQGEAAIVAMLAPLSAGFAGAFGLQDDCALLSEEPGTELVLKTDPVAEGVHFLAGTAPQDIAWKALAVNVSDLAAKAATPVGYLMALSFPQAPTRDWMARFVAGLGEAQARFACHLIGGDTDRRPGPLTVSITAIGRVPAGAMVRRGTAKAGDALYVSGSIGDAGLGLALLKDASLAARWGLTAEEREALQRRHMRPEPRLALGPALRAHARAAMDVSDGLVKDLERLARASGVSARLEAAAVPMSAAARKALGSAPERLVMGLITAGDDYEILAAVAPDRTGAFAAEAAAAGIAVTRIGSLGPGPVTLEIIGADGRPMTPPQRSGWDHF